MEAGSSVRRVTPAAETRERLEIAAASGELDPLCERLGIELLGVFGSAAAGTSATATSDVDVCVRFVDGARGDVLALIDALTSLTGFERFDVLDLAQAGPVARKEALFGNDRPVLVRGDGRRRRDRRPAGLAPRPGGGSAQRPRPPDVLER